MDTLLYVIVGAVVFGFIGWYLAPRRGREPVLWGIVCALTWLLGVIVLLVLPPKTPAMR